MLVEKSCMVNIQSAVGNIKICQLSRFFILQSFEVKALLFTWMNVPVDPM